MELDETMVEQGEPVADDALQEELTEETDESKSLESILEGTDEDEPADDSDDNRKQGTSEPGWIKKRVDKAVQKAVAETEARMKAEFESQMAPLRAKMLEDEARELVRKGTVKDLETAKELVRYRQGQPQPVRTESSEQSRNDKGQFAQNRDPATSARIEMLTHQAERIKSQRGIDVIEAFSSDDNVKQKVVSGEWDFYDAAEYLAASKKKVPSPMRSPNGASGSEKSTIASMSDEQFERLEKSLKGGARYAIK